MIGLVALSILDIILATTLFSSSGSFGARVVVIRLSNGVLEIISYAMSTESPMYTGLDSRIIVFNTRSISDAAVGGFVMTVVAAVICFAIFSYMLFGSQIVPQHSWDDNKLTRSGHPQGSDA